MHRITLPDPVYAQAKRAAAAIGLSVEEYICEVLLHIEDEAPVRLTSEQAAIVARAESEIDAGNGIPLEQVRSDLVAHRQLWRAQHP